MIEAMAIGRRTIDIGQGDDQGDDPARDQGAAGISPELAPLLGDPRFLDLWSVTTLAMAISDLDLRPAPSVESQEATFVHVYDWIMRDHSD